MNTGPDKAILDLVEEMRAQRRRPLLAQLAALYRRLVHR